MIAVMTGLFALWTLPFWVLLIVTCAALAWLTEHDKGLFATLTAVVFFGLLAVAGDFNILVAARDNPWLAVGAFFAYIVCGVTWSIPKWGFFVADRVVQYRELELAFLQFKGRKDVTKVPPDLIGDWRQYLRDKAFDDRDYGHAKKADVHLDEVPRALNFKSRIVAWMAFWPTSMMWTVWNNFVLKVFQRAFTLMMSTYDRMAAKMYANIVDELAQPPPVAPAGNNDSGHGRRHGRAGGSADAL